MQTKYRELPKNKLFNNKMWKTKILCFYSFKRKTLNINKYLSISNNK